MTTARDLHTLHRTTFAASQDIKGFGANLLAAGTVLEGLTRATHKTPEGMTVQYHIFLMIAFRATLEHTRDALVSFVGGTLKQADAADDIQDAFDDEIEKTNKVISDLTAGGFELNDETLPGLRAQYAAEGGEDESGLPAELVELLRGAFGPNIKIVNMTGDLGNLDRTGTDD